MWSAKRFDARLAEIERLYEVFLERAWPAIQHPAGRGSVIRWRVQNRITHRLEHRRRRERPDLQGTIDAVEEELGP